MRVRVHQHVNPLSPFYRQQTAAIDPNVFPDPERPLFLDIGCARGRFLLKMAAEDRTFNYVGIEIRQPLVEEANRLAHDAGLDNLHYVFGNAMLWMKELLADVPDGLLQTAAIQFPDPWFKKKHAKRRMVNHDLVAAVAEKMAAGGNVIVQTDIEFLAEEMFEIFRAEPRFAEEVIDAAPFPVKTERENAVEGKGLPVYRRRFVKR